MYTKQDIKNELSRMGAPKDSVVLVHTALRTVGEVEGGGEGLLDALIEYFTEDGGLLAVPTHTWANLGTDKITLDLTKAESNLGKFPEIAAADARGIRSENPTHSMTVFGGRERAERFVADDKYVKTPTAPESCYGKLYEWGGKVLLIGVAHNRNTYLHAVDEILGIPNRMSSDKAERVSVRGKDGSIRESELFLFDTDYISDISLRFPKLETAFRYRGAITDGFIGDAPTQLADARIMKETMEIIYKRADGKDPLADEKPIPPVLFIK